MRMLRLAAAMGLSLLAAGPALAQKKATLVIGLDISDGRNYDTARSSDLTPPLTLGAVYDTLVTLAPDDLVNLKPGLATEWTPMDGGKTWRFKLRPGVKFWDGSPFAAEDVKFSLDRLINLKDQPAIVAANMGAVTIVDPMTVDVGVKNPAEPLLIDMTSPAFYIYSKKMALAQGAVADPGADQTDKATNWLNSVSAGTGAYHMVRWERNSEVELRRNPNWWGGTAPFERIVIRHISDGGAQLLAVRKGDIDIAMNLSAEQLDTLAGNADVKVIQGSSTDTLYFMMSSDTTLNPVLAKPEARRAVAMALDYDGMIKALVGGFAERPPSFLPNGIAGTTAAQTKAFGYHEDLAKARQLLAAAGAPAGFEFELTYPSATYFSTSYALLTQKMQADLARVGIKMTLRPMDNVNWRSQFNAGKLQATMAPWNSPSPNPYLWTGASVQRVAARMRWTPDQEIKDIVSAGAAELDAAKQAVIYERYARILVDNANYVTLMQPIYRVAVNKSVADVQLTANVWKMELTKVRPAN